MNHLSRSAYFRFFFFVSVILSCWRSTSGSAALGQTLWLNPLAGSWTTGSNWSLGVPNSGSATAFDARIDNGGMARLAAAGASVRRLRVGTSAGGGTLKVDGGGL